MRFVYGLLLTMICAWIGITIQRGFDWPYWMYHVSVICIGFVLYVINSILTKVFIKRHAADCASNEEVMPGVQKWELTAGRGIVPKWVSCIGLFAFGFLLASPFELLALLVRTFNR